MTVFSLVNDFVLKGYHLFSQKFMNLFPVVDDFFLVSLWLHRMSVPAYSC